MLVGKLINDNSQKVAFEITEGRYKIKGAEDKKKNGILIYRNKNFLFKFFAAFKRDGYWLSRSSARRYIELQIKNNDDLKSLKAPKWYSSHKVYETSLNAIAQAKKQSTSQMPRTSQELQAPIHQLSGQQPPLEPLAKPLPEPVQESPLEPLAEPVQESPLEPLAEPVQEPVQESLSEPLPEPSHESLPEPSQEPLKSELSQVLAVQQKPISVELSEVLLAYNPAFAPQANQKNLLDYSKSEDYQRHAGTARIYFNSSQLAKEDALQIAFQREPTNIAMRPNQYNEKKLEELFGYRKGVYNDVSIRKKDGSSYRDLPNSVAIYSETYLWSPPGGESKKEIACLSLPAPALDVTAQPHFNYYIQNGTLDAAKYEKEMAFLFSCVEKAIRDHKETAFKNSGIKRVVLSRFGQGSFLAAISDAQKQIVYECYRKQLAAFLVRMKDVDIDIFMSEYSDPGRDIWHEKMIIGDIIETAKEGDLIINAWDPHSAPGNGNDADYSFDGAMGKSSGILLTQTAWLNAALKHERSLEPVQNQ